MADARRTKLEKRAKPAGSHSKRQAAADIISRIVYLKKGESNAIADVNELIQEMIALL